MACSCLADAPGGQLQWSEHFSLFCFLSSGVPIVGGHLKTLVPRNAQRLHRLSRISQLVSLSPIQWPMITCHKFHGGCSAAGISSGVLHDLTHVRIIKGQLLRTRAAKRKSEIFKRVTPALSGPVVQAHARDAAVLQLSQPGPRVPGRLDLKHGTRWSCANGSSRHAWYRHY